MPDENGLDMALDDLISAGGKGKGKSRKGRGKGSKDSWSDWSGGGSWSNGRGSDKWDTGSGSGERTGKDALDMALDDLVSSDSGARGKGKGWGKKGRDYSSEDSGWSDWKGGSSAWAGGGSDRWGNGSSSKWGGGGASSQDWGSWGRSGGSGSGGGSWGAQRRQEPERWDGGRGGGGGGRDSGFSWAGGGKEARGGERYGGDGWDPHRGTKRGHESNDHRATKSKVIKVTNIPSGLTDEDITEAFEAETGKILSCDMNSRKGTAMIRFARAEDAMKAAETFDRGELNGKIILVTVEPGY